MTSLSPRKVNRRQLAAIAGRTGAAGIVAGCAPAFAQGGADQRVRVAFIGTGNQGMGLLKRMIGKDLAQVVAVCDVNEGSYGYKQDDHFYGREPAAKFVNDHYAKHKTGFEQCVAVKEHERVLERKDIDAVLIVVPDHSHKHLTVDAAAAGKDIYCEKPLSFSVADGAEMVRAVRQQGVLCQTGSHERSNPVSRFVCEAVKAGKIGTIKRIVTKVGYNNKVGPGPGWKAMPVPKTFDYARWLGPAPKVPYHQDRCLYRFRFNYDYSGGQITNFGAHCNDMANWGMDLDTEGPETIECLKAEFLPEGSLFNTATETIFRATYANGVELVCESGPEQVQTRFEGADGWMQTGYRGTTASSSDLLEGLPTKVDANGHDPHTAHMADFIACVKSRQTPRAPVEVGHNSATLCHLANVAIRRFPRVGKETLKWDHTRQRFIDHDEANQMLGFS
ncbi:MAG: Gfo/Idh/MocA family oxidoreductase [Planctomycetota bacterium]